MNVGLLGPRVSHGVPSDFARLIAWAWASLDTPVSKLPWTSSPSVKVVINAEAWD